MMKIPMTLFEKKYLEEELLKLVSIERPSVQEALHEARALGDLKENADYHANKEKQALLEGRILEIQGKLAQGEVIDISKTSSSTIVFGATVTLFDCSKNKEVVYTIVGEEEAKLSGFKISFRSPLAKELIGKKTNDQITIQAPKGELQFIVKSFTFKS